MFNSNSIVPDFEVEMASLIFEVRMAICPPDDVNFTALLSSSKTLAEAGWNRPGCTVWSHQTRWKHSVFFAAIA